MEESLSIKDFDPGLFSGQRFSAIWNEALREDKRHPDWYIKRHAARGDMLDRIFSNRDIEPGGIKTAFSKEEPAGVAIGAVIKTKSFPDSLPGYLTGLAVSPAKTGRGAGRALLSSVEDYFQSRGKITARISLHYSPAAGMSVIPGSRLHEFLSKNGFECLDNQMELHIDLKGFSIGKKVLGLKNRLEKKGVNFGFCGPRLNASFSRMMEENFKHWWHSFYRQNAGRECPAGVLAASAGDEVIGFSGPVLVFPGGSCILSIGVVDSYRGMGIGRVLANMWALENKNAGASESLISTGTGNVPAQKIYFEMGFRKIGEYISEMEKKLRAQPEAAAP